MANVLKPNGERNFTQLVTMTKQITRSTEVAMKQKLREYCIRTFYMRYRGEGYSEPEIEAMWVAATTPEMFRKKMAFKKGQVDWVWRPLARTASKKDIMTGTLKGESEQLHVSKDTASDMLTGKQSISVDSGHLLGVGSAFDDDGFQDLCFGDAKLQNEVPALGESKKIAQNDSVAEG